MTSQDVPNDEFAKVLEALGATERISVPDDTLEEIFWRMHPRFRTFKTMPLGGIILDIGAGGGGLARWKEWLEPVRPDLVLHAVDLNRGEWADEYQSWTVADLDEGPANLPDMRFDGFFASHLVEHIASLDALLAYMDGVALGGSLAYIEWPSVRTMRYPSAKVLAELGFEIQISNFFDDSTHRQTYSIADVAARLQRHGFRPVEQGEIRLGILAEELMARGRRLDRLEWRQTGFWSSIGWCSYVIAEHDG